MLLLLSLLAANFLLSTVFSRQVLFCMSSLHGRQRFSFISDRSRVCVGARRLLWLFVGWVSSTVMVVWWWLGARLITPHVGSSALTADLNIEIQNGADPRHFFGLLHCPTTCIRRTDALQTLPRLDRLRSHLKLQRVCLKAWGEFVLLFSLLLHIHCYSVALFAVRVWPPSFISGIISIGIKNIRRA